MALELRIWDRDNIKQITGQKINQQVMGSLLPSFKTEQIQFLRTVPNRHTTLKFLAGTYISLKVGDTNLLFGSDQDVEFDMESVLDSGTNYTPGKDYYVYIVLVNPVDSGSLYTAKFVISANSTFPDGATADTSRKIGGFHTICANIPNDTLHATKKLAGYNAGEILPNSIWDLSHRSETLQEGMTYDHRMNHWVMIYLPSGNGENTKSIFGGTPSKNRSGVLFFNDLASIGCKPLDYTEFISATKENLALNILGSAAITNTGGHQTTTGVRIVSDIGVEDGCGVEWQLLRDVGSAATAGSATTNGMASGNGAWYFLLTKLFAGGSYNTGTGAGPAAITVINGVGSVATNGNSTRGCAKNIDRYC